MNLASKNVFILCYRASKIVQSFMEEFAQKGVEKLSSKRIGYLKPTLRKYFSAFFSAPVLLWFRYYSD